jgi:simple sugar transport system permease protein
MRGNRALVTTAVVLAVLYVAASISYRGFFSWYQFASFFNDKATLGLVAVGMTFVILGGGIDLSVGAMIALTSLMAAKAVAVAGWSPALAVPLVVAFAAAFGAGQGAVIRRFGLPPFLVTLAGMFLARGCALVLTRETRLSLTDDPFFARLGAWRWLDFTAPALLFLVVLGIGVWAARWTRFGRAVYAIGGNESSALLMGLPVGATKVGMYALSGCCAGLGGVAHAVGSGAGDATIASMMELDAIAAVVIGGTLLSGGVGTVFGTLLGVLITAIVTAIPTYVGTLNASWTRIWIGGLLLGFILLQRAGARAGRGGATAT